MRSISVISSLIYIVIFALYSLFGKSDSSVWSSVFYVNTGLYIGLILLDNILKSTNRKEASLLIGAIVFQVLLVMFEVYLVVWCEPEYFKLVNSMFWSGIIVVLILVYVIIYKILFDLWENG